MRILPAVFVVLCLGAGDCCGAPPAEGEADRAQEQEIERLVAAAAASVEDGRWQEALAAAESALSLSPREADAHAARLLSLVALGRYAEARRALAELHERLPMRAVDTTATVLTWYGDLSGARSVLEQCVDRVQPRNPFCWVQLVRIHLARGEEEAALRRARQALERAKPGAVLDRLWTVLWDAVFLEHDRKRVERFLGRPLPAGKGRGEGAGEASRTALRAYLPVLHAPEATVELPLGFEGGWPFVAAEIGGRSARLVLDTGASHLHVSRAFARRAGLRTVGRAVVLGEGGGGEVEEDFGVFRRLRLGGIVLERVAATVADGSLAPGDGVLGTALLKDFLVDLDFPRRRLRLAPARHEVEKAFPDLPPGTTSLQIVVFKGVPLLPGGINRRLLGWFLLDTGATSDFFNLRHRPRLDLEAGVRPARPPGEGETVRSFGIAGMATGTYLSPLTANLGPFVTDYAHMPAVVFRAETGVWQLGAWGMNTLQNYRLVLDYGRRRVYVWWSGLEGKEAPERIVHLDHPEPDLGGRLGLRWE